MTSLINPYDLNREQLDALNARMMADPQAVLTELAVMDAEEHLIDFAEFIWPVIEPGRDFTRGWCLEAICEHLEAVSRGDIQNILMNVPPGTMKSLSTNVLWPSWEWGPRNQPHLRYVSAAYSQSLTIRDNRRTRQIVQSDLFQEHWPLALTGDQNEKVKFENEHTGFKLATSVGGTVMGERGDRVIVDDPNDTRRSDSEAHIDEALQWFTEVLPTRVNDLDKTPVVVIMQRVNERDVSGHILASELGYEHLCLPMEFDQTRRCHSIIKPSYMDSEPAEVARIPGSPGVWVNEEQADEAYAVLETHDEDAIAANPFAQELKTVKPHQLDFTPRYPIDPRQEDGEYLFPERFPGPAVERLKKTLSSWGGQYAVAGQLDQRPTPRGGGMFKREDFRIVDADKAPVGGRSVRGWDLAASDEKEKGAIAQTAGVKMRVAFDGTLVIEEAVAGKWGPGDAEKRIKQTAEDDGLQVTQDLPQDPGQAGKSQKRQLSNLLAKFDCRISPETGSKVDRARPLAAKAENGGVVLVRGAWNEAFLAEAEKFPRGKTKDYIDAATRAYSRAQIMSGDYQEDDMDGEESVLGIELA